MAKTSPPPPPSVPPIKEGYVRFMAPVTAESATSLLRIIDKKITQGVKRLHLLISSPGGTVFHGISVCNYLRGAPLEVYTYNFGSVDSIGVVLFCSGLKRFSVPHARFLLHGVRFNTPGPMSFDEKSLDEHLKSINIDQFNIARIVADTCGKTVKQITDCMNARTTLNPDQAKRFGLVHSIRSELVPANADLDIVYEDNTIRSGLPSPFPGAPMLMPFQIRLPGQVMPAPSPMAPVPPAPPAEPGGPAAYTAPQVESYTLSSRVGHYTSLIGCGT